ncbi:RNA-binding protein [Nanoarchaeota archaeon]
MAVPNVTKRRIIKYLNEGKRFDGRKQFEFRDLVIETGVSKKAEGSARVKLGKTEVLVGVKLALGTPYPDSADSGTLMVTAELSPMASEVFEKGPPSITSIMLARTIDRGIRESEAVDMKQLCVTEGVKVWSLFLDIYAMNDDGNLIDAASLGAMAALKTAVFPKIEGEGADAKVLFGELTDKKLPLKDAYPLTMTFYKIGDKIVLDPTTEEEGASETKLSVAISIDKKKEVVNALQKDGDETFTIDDLQLMMDEGTKEIKRLLPAFEKATK